MLKPFDDMNGTGKQEQAAKEKSKPSRENKKQIQNYACIFLCLRIQGGYFFVINKPQRYLSP